MPLHDTAVVKASIGPASRTNGTVNGTAVGLTASGADSALVAFISGAVTDGTHTPSVEESDTGTGGWTAVPVGQLTGSLTPITTSNALVEVGVQRSKAFLRAVLVTTAATTGGNTAAVVVLGESGSTPISRT